MRPLSARSVPRGDGRRVRRGKGGRIRRRSIAASTGRHGDTRGASAGGRLGFRIRVALCMRERWRDACPKMTGRERWRDACPKMTGRQRDGAGPGEARHKPCGFWIAVARLRGRRGATPAPRRDSAEGTAGDVTRRGTGNARAACPRAAVAARAGGNPGDSGSLCRWPALCRVYPEAR